MISRQSGIARAALIIAMIVAAVFNVGWPKPTQRSAAFSAHVQDKTFHGNATIDSLSEGDISCNDGVSVPRLNASKPAALTWIPGYPGSGSVLVRNLIHGMTGLDADDVYKEKCNRNSTITCKTHWPFRARKIAPTAPYRFRPGEFNKNVIMLLRNPCQSIPSFFNFEYEHNNHLEGHSVQAPESAWQRWRDKHVEKAIQHWANVIEAWKRLDPFQISLYLSFERLTTPETGPLAVQELARQLQVNSGLEISSELNHSTCLWNNLVQQGRKGKRSEHAYVPKFRKEQTDHMIEALDKLVDAFRGDAPLVEQLEQYKADIAATCWIETTR